MSRELLFALLLIPSSSTCLGADLSPGNGEEIGPLFREFILRHLPRDYENRRQWGGTKEVWDGLHISLEGPFIKTKRRTKQANHGTWKRYRAWIIDPERNLIIRLSEPRRTDSGRAAFDLAVHARIGAFGRLSEWQRDVQLFSLGVDAEARVTLRMRCELGLSLDFDQLPPDVVVDPVVREASLVLDDFELQRISNLNGPLARQLGESLHDVLQAEIDKRRDKLVDRINSQIEKNRDRLRLSPRRLLDEAAVVPRR